MIAEKRGKLIKAIKSTAMDHGDKFLGRKRDLCRLNDT
jgi:hypothetical protein